MIVGSSTVVCIVDNHAAIRLASDRDLWLGRRMFRKYVSIASVLAKSTGAGGGGDPCDGPQTCSGFPSCWDKSRETTVYCMSDRTTGWGVMSETPEVT